MKIPYLEAKNIAQYKGIKHGFFTRKGGVSDGIYDSLNVGRGSKDDQKKIGENRARVRSVLGAGALCSLAQIHSAKVVEVKMPWLPAEMPEADAMVTNRQGLALGVLSADCVPVLFVDAAAGVIGAAHSGWKGALAGVIANTVSAMQDMGADIDNIYAAIGPAIEQESYQVDAVFYANFISQDKHSERFFERDPSSASHYNFDLKTYVLMQCQRSGLNNVETLPHNTYVEEDLFYSYRRTCHRGQSDYGRQVSAIMLKD